MNLKKVNIPLTQSSLLRYEAAVQKATHDLEALQYTEGQYETEEENCRNFKVQVILIICTISCPDNYYKDLRY